MRHDRRQEAAFMFSNRRRSTRVPVFRSDTPASLTLPPPKTPKTRWPDVGDNAPEAVLWQYLPMTADFVLSLAISAVIWYSTDFESLSLWANSVGKKAPGICDTEKIVSRRKIYGPTLEVMTSGAAPPVVWRHGNRPDFARRRMGRPLATCDRHELAHSWSGNLVPTRA